MAVFGLLYKKEIKMDDYYGSNEDFGGDSGGNWDYNYNPDQDNLAWNDVNSQYSPQAPQGGDVSSAWSGNQNQDYQFNLSDSMPNDMYEFGSFGGDTGQQYNPMSGFQQDNPYGAQELNYAAQNQGGDTGGIDYAKWGGKGLDLLGKVLGGAGAAGAGGMSGSNSYLKTLMNLFAANQEKKSNQQMATQIPQRVQQFRQQASPFDAAPGVVDPNSMRGIAQSQYSQSMADPYGSKIVSDQVNQMKAAQARKDAAAGRRSNTAYSSPAMLAASADAAMKYQNQLGQQAGAGQFMGQSGLNELVQGLKYGAQGNSPYFSAAGYGANANNISGNPELAKLVAALSGKG